jgi:hypothetical protein
VRDGAHEHDEDVTWTTKKGGVFVMENTWTDWTTRETQAVWRWIDSDAERRSTAWNLGSTPEPDWVARELRWWLERDAADLAAGEVDWTQLAARLIAEVPEHLRTGAWAAEVPSLAPGVDA